MKFRLDNLWESLYPCIWIARLALKAWLALKPWWALKVRLCLKVWLALKARLNLKAWLVHYNYLSKVDSKWLA